MGWFRSHGWTPFDFQVEAWRAFAAGRDGLIHAPTGMGKTLAAWMGLVEEEAMLAGAGAARSGPRSPLRALWLTPLRALAGDTAAALQGACDGVGLGWKIELRTGDTSASVKKRQQTRPPQGLVTTPESLCVLLSRADGPELLRDLKLVVVDEWHELIGGKRGTLTELALSRLRAIAPGLRTWGVSATLANTREAMDALLGFDGAGASRATDAVLVRDHHEKHHEIVTAIPEKIEAFPWSGHLGLRQLPAVIQAIENAKTSLVFCNTRGQAEIWFQSLVKARPEWLGGPGEPAIALHHGSLDRDIRTRVETLLKNGSVRAVVCTSSLDLGVDFPPVDQVIQIGSPKGVARLLQRAGRSGHQPGRASRVVCVPTNAMEVVEFAAVRNAVRQKSIEARRGVTMALDVLCQHILTCACAGPISESELLAQVRTAAAFRMLTDQQWSWAVDFAIRGGAALNAYDRFKRVERDHGMLRVHSPAIARLHRLAIGTILSDASIAVRWTSGGLLGTMEESFISKLSPGDVFVFSGRRLELVHLREMTATVRPSTKRSASFASWQGARMPLSSELARHVRELLEEADSGIFNGPEMQASQRLLTLQREWSALPTPGRLVIERTTTREGHHAFVYPLLGRLAHEGLASLCAYRLAKESPRSFSIACNDYGFELVSPTPIDDGEQVWRRALSDQHLERDLLECVNASGMARRHFREIARIAGLIVPGFPSRGPGSPRMSTKHMQASSELYFDVFRDFDPDNLLLAQARREVLTNQLEFARVVEALAGLRERELVFTAPVRLTPMSFPLWADRLREQLTSEQWSQRVERMLASLEAQAGGAAAVQEAVDPRLAGGMIEPPTSLARRRNRGRTRAVHDRL